jgi:hypothetical protein
MGIFMVDIALVNEFAFINTNKPVFIESCYHKSMIVWRKCEKHEQFKR